MSRLVLSNGLALPGPIGKMLLALSMIIVCAGCPATPSNQRSGGASAGSFSGRWEGNTGGLTVSLILQQAGDSITGSGTYQVAPGASIGCGGETIPSSGNVTVNGKLTDGNFQGHMSFGDVWIPPYLGTLKSPDSFDGHFMSVDRGGCALTLARQH
jgi:hypothetical protein